MTSGAASAEASRAGRLLPLLLVPIALLCDPAAALPLSSYYFRDFGNAFYPLRLLQARELAAGQLATWNRYVFEGTFLLPTLYPVDLLHALWPSPVFVSWLLTLHLPLAALGAYWLARELGATPAAAFAAGVVYSLSGFTLSALNLYVFLQALALAPFQAGLLRRAALVGGRAVGWAGLVVALGLATYTVEFVGQAVLLGIALGLCERPTRLAFARVAFALALGCGLAGVPIALVLGVLSETGRGAGFGADVALANAVHPVVLLQTVVPHLFGFPEAPAEAFWGGRFFSRGLPYFLTLYLGPLALGLAAIGLSRIDRRQRLVLASLAGLGLWYALGAAGGLAPLVHRLGLSAAFRYPSKALLLPQIAVALAAGFGFGRIGERSALRDCVAAVGLAAALALAVWSLVASRPAWLVAWSGVRPDFWPQLAGVVARDATVAVLLAAAAGGVLWLRARERIGSDRAAALVAALLVADLVHAGAGLNPQVDPRFYRPLPGLAALKLAELDGRRVFSYGLDYSPAFREFLARGGPALTATSFFLHRQLLGPYSNVLDSVEAAEANDLTSLAPRERELSPEQYDPERAGQLVPWLRNAGVARVLSLDPLNDPALVPLASLEAGPPGVSVRVYAIDGWPRGSFACRATPVSTRAEALAFPYRAGFDPSHDVALEEPGGERAALTGPAMRCGGGSARLTALSTGEERYAVGAGTDGYLVVRASYARGWQATVDGVPQPVRRANGKHRAVAVPAGSHEVVLRYAPPGLRLGELVSGVAAVAAVLLLLLGTRRR